MCVCGKVCKDYHRSGVYMAMGSGSILLGEGGRVREASRNWMRLMR